jgi:hypothetical protein
MYGFSIRQEDNPQIPAIHLGHRCPTANAAVLLNDLLDGVIDHSLNPLKLDYQSIWPQPHRLKVLGKLHRRDLRTTATSSKK